ncbi:MAG: ATP-binding protein, partial [Verrucomicrobiae bacterium]|nr:ATP-binding protein [Verrucomicrobiae bacterium]
MSENNHTHAFQAEVRQLLDIVIHSLYTDKEIFVRELVSNASDALEKLRHLQLTEKEIFEPETPLEIRITTDEEAGTITIEDRGIGMSHDELVENLGTIAHSGSKKFMQALSEAGQKESSLIGQFGVGFYSAFMVADDVKVYTHSWRPDAEPLAWSSDGQTGYSI